MSLFARVRAAFFADSPPGASNFALETSMSFMDGVRRLKRHEWCKYDLQYLVMIPLLVFCFFVCYGLPLLLRVAIVVLLIYLCVVPAFGQFFWNFMPTGTWLMLFFATRYIPPAWRPSIYVRVLPSLETILYGSNLSEILASRTNAVLDILAWIPYGLVHFGAPAVVSLLCFLFGPPTLLPVFHFAFGYMNIVGVLIQLLFPNAPPWYQSMYGLQKANYGMHGSAGGLARIDQILGLNLYTTGFEGSPLVFGAFPSLHSGSAVMEALFMSYLFPQFAPLFWVYVTWIWWATMYLTHHYFVDLICGAMLSLSVYSLCAITIMPRKQPGKFGRWSYEHVKYGIREPRVPSFRKSFDEESLLFDDELGEHQEMAILKRPDAKLLARNATPPSSRIASLNLANQSQASIQSVHSTHSDPGIALV